MKRYETGRMPRLFFFLFLCAYALLSGCFSHEILWQSHQEIPTSTWLSQEALSFELRVPERDQIKGAVLWLDTRYESHYRYENLYTSYQLKDSTGRVLREAIYEVLLFDSQSGKPLGEGAGGVFFKHDSLFSFNDLPYQSKYQMVIRQFMRLDSLSGIRSIGLRVVSSAKH